MSLHQENIISKFPPDFPLSKERISGWGLFSYVDCLVARPKNIDELRLLLKISVENNFSITPKGSGCSFGDIITNRQGLVLDLTSWNKIISFDHESGILTAQCGVSAGKVLHLTLPHHWILRGLPGTSFGTMGGLIGNNVHGKDSFKTGNFGTGVLSMKMLLANGEIISLSPKENPDIFHAAIGGMGLLGIITEATFQLIKIPGSMVEVKRKFFSSISDLFTLIKDMPDDVDMDASWLDAFDKNGRGIFQTARWLDKDPVPYPPSMELVGKKFMGKIPTRYVYPLVSPFVYRFTMKLLNKLAYWASKLTGKESTILHIYNYYYPHMISIPDSPKAIKGGLVGFQILAPETGAREFIPKLLELCREFKLESWFCGIKKLKADDFLVSFADDGYAITIEMPGRFTQKNTFPLFLEKMVAMTTHFKGKIFLGKDALLKADHVRAFYPRLQDFLNIKLKLDPDKLFASDLSRRLLL